MPALLQLASLLCFCTPFQSLAVGPLNVGIVGAGPAGLSLAIALRSLLGGSGVRLRIFDRSDQLQPQLGGGLQLNSGAAVLGRLGLRQKLLASGNPARRVVSRNVDRDILLELDLHAAIREDARSKDVGLVDDEGNVLAVTIMRDKLQQILAAELPNEAFKLDKALVDVALVGSQGQHMCRCMFADGEEADFDLVVGADGMRSVVRDRVVGGSADSPGYTGIRIQWALAPAGSRPAGTESELHQWFGRGAYCLSATYGGRDGLKQDQCVVVYGDSSGQSAMNPDWQPTDAKESMLARLEASGMPAEVLSLAAACNRHFELGSYFRNPLVSWSGLKGHAALLGDAAHGMPPFLGQGANQAVQDAYCLAAELKAFQEGRHASLADALGAYEGARKLAVMRGSVVARLTLNSRILGFVETALPDAGRDAFFRTTSALGIAKFVFLDGALPKV